MKIKINNVETGYLYLTTLNQYRAVLAMKDEFLIYAPPEPVTIPSCPDNLAASGLLRSTGIFAGGC